MSEYRETPEQKRQNEAMKKYSPVKPGFDGTQPKIVHDTDQPVFVSTKELVERDADKQDTTVAELKIAAAESEANTGKPDPIDGEEVPVGDAEAAEVAEETEEEEVVNLTVAELKEALDAAGVEYPSHALKADLQQLYDDANLGQ